MKRIALTFLLLVLMNPFIPAPVHAREADSRQFLPAGSVDAHAIIKPPAAVDTAAFREQMAVVLWMQLTRPPAQVEFVQRSLNVERFGPLLGRELMSVDGIELTKTIDTAIGEVRAEYDAIKHEYGLPRPFQVSDAIEPVTEPRPVASYPSGHATRAIVYARLLAEVFPEKRQVLLDLAYQIGYGRVLAGVHYPMDVLAGQALGTAYSDVIVGQSAFRQAVERIRQPRARSPERAEATLPAD